MAASENVSDDELERLCDPTYWFRHIDADTSTRVAELAAELARRLLAERRLSNSLTDTSTRVAELAAELARRLLAERRLSNSLTESIATARKLLELVAGNVQGIAETLKRFEE